MRLVRRSGAGASSTLSAAPPAPSLSPSPSHGSLPAGPHACPHPPVAHRSRAHVLGGPWGGFKGMESCRGARCTQPHPAFGAQRHQVTSVTHSARTAQTQSRVLDGTGRVMGTFHRLNFCRPFQLRSRCREIIGKLSPGLLYSSGVAEKEEKDFQAFHAFCWRQSLDGSRDGSKSGEPGARCAEVWASCGAGPGRRGHVRAAHVGARPRSPQLGHPKTAPAVTCLCQARR